MPGTCSDWPAYGCEWTIEYLWRWTHLMERLDLLLLALLLVHTVIVGVRAARRYRLARRTEGIDTASETFQRAGRKLVAELKTEVRRLKSIASIAPYVGLAGTTLGILDLLSEGFSGSRSTAIVWLSVGMAAAILPSAAGLLVAIPAVACRNFLHTRIESLEIEVHGRALERGGRYARVAQCLPLAKRFSGLPAFALVAAPVLALSSVFMSLFMSLSSIPRRGCPSSRQKLCLSWIMSHPSRSRSSLQ